ncbi:MAG: hypothetical protein Tsb0020_16730 [Haliangiales bacterium]
MTYQENTNHSPLSSTGLGAETIEPAVQTARLATRGARFMAALVDAIVLNAIIIPIQYSFGVWDNFPRMSQLNAGEMALYGAMGFAIWFLLQVYFLRQGQTIGKKLARIRMVNYGDGSRVSVGRLVSLRYLPINIVVLIPVIGPYLNFINILFIFGSERRCIHDHIAGTKVVQA